VLPMLRQPLAYYGDYFINTFVRDENYPDYDSHIFVLFDSSFVVDDKDSYHNLCSSEHYETDYCVGDYHMIIFNIPDEFYVDYQLFLASKYSKFTKEYKKVLTHTWPSVVQGKHSLTIAALYPDSEKSKGHKLDLEEKIGERLPEGVEIISVIDSKKETFKLNNFYEVIV